MSKKSTNPLHHTKEYLDAINQFMSNESGVEIKIEVTEWDVQRQGRALVFKPKADGAEIFFITNGLIVLYFSKEVTFDEAYAELTAAIKSEEVAPVQELPEAHTPLNLNEAEFDNIEETSLDEESESDYDISEGLAEPEDLLEAEETPDSIDSKQDEIEESLEQPSEEEFVMVVQEASEGMANIAEEEISEVVDLTETETRPVTSPEEKELVAYMNNILVNQGVKVLVQTKTFTGSATSIHGMINTSMLPIVKAAARRTAVKRFAYFALSGALLAGITLVSISNIFGGDVTKAKDAANAAQLETACSTINIKDCEIIEEFSDLPQGTLLSQSVRAGGHLIMPTSVELTYSIGQKTPEVPNLVGLTQKDAEKELFNVGLEVGRVLIEDSLEVEAGRVITTKQEVGSKVDNRSAVDIVISSDKVHLPDWAGMSKDAIEMDAKKKNISIKFEEEDSNDITPGLAIRQSVTPENYDGKETVVITLARAAEANFIKVPEVVGKSLEMAQGLLISAGFTNISIVEVENNVTETSVTHVVPGVDQSVGSDENIVIIVSKPISN